MASTVGVKNPYRYRGYRYDSGTELYYLNSRYYNSEWGRFINGDSFGGRVGQLLSHNVFSYCKNNAINMVDTSGYLSIWNRFKNFVAFKAKQLINTAKAVVSISKKVINTAISSIEAEAGVGAGLGIGIKINKKNRVQIGAYVERYTAKIDNKKVSIGSQIQAGAAVKVSKLVDVGAEYSAYNTFAGSRYTDSLIGIAEDPNSIIERSLSFDVGPTSVSQDDFTIGFGGQIAVGIEVRFDIQFNVTEFIASFKNN